MSSRYLDLIIALTGVIIFFIGWRRFTHRRDHLHHLLEKKKPATSQKRRVEGGF